MDGLIAHILQELAFEGDLGSDVSRLRQIISQYYSTQPPTLCQPQNVDDKFCAFVWELLTRQENVAVGVAPDGAAAVYFPPQASKAKGTGKNKGKGQPDPTSAASLSPLSPDEITTQPLDALLAQYGGGLRIAVAPDVSFVCITGSHIRPPKLSTNAYAVLQLITRSRREGISVADISRQSGYDSKTCFYFIKILVELGHIHKIKVGGSAVNICVHKSFYDDQCVWKQATKEEAMEEDNPPIGPEVEGEEGGSEGAPKEYTGNIQFEPIDNRHMSNPVVVKARIERLLRHMPHGLHVYQYLLEAIGFKTSAKKERRIFTHRVTELLKSRFIEKVWAQSSTSTTGRVLCIRLVTNDPTPGSLDVAEDDADDEPQNTTVEGAPTAEGVDQEKADAMGGLEQFEGVYATQSIASQIISMVEESDTTGMTLSEISKSLHNFDIRSVTNLTARFSAGQPPTHLAHRALVIVTEMFGRERRQRLYTLDAYHRMIEEEGLEDQSVLDSKDSGAWAVFEPDDFVANETEREEWLGDFVRKALVHGGEKAREQKGKKGRVNPLDKDGVPIKGRPRKEWAQQAKAPKQRGQSVKRKVDEVEEGDGLSQPPTQKKRRGRPPKTKPADGNELVDNATTSVADGPPSVTDKPPAEVTRKRGRPRKKQPPQPEAVIAPDQSTGTSFHENPDEEPAGGVECGDSGGTTMDAVDITAQNQRDEQSDRQTRDPVTKDLIPSRTSRSPSPGSSSRAHPPKRPRRDGPTELGHREVAVTAAVIVPPTLVPPPGLSLEGLITVPDREREPTPEVEGINNGPAVITGQIPDNVQAGQSSAQPARQGKTTNVSALRRQTEFLQLIENMGGVVNISLLKSFNDEHQKLLLALHAAGKAVSTAPGTEMDKRTCNSTISALEGRGLIKTLVVSALTAHGATRRATIVHLIGASLESIDKCIEEFRSSGSTKGIPLSSDYPQVPTNVSHGLNKSASKPPASTPPISPLPPTDPLSEGRQAHLSEAHTAAQYVGYIPGHFSRVRALHLRLLSELGSETPPTSMVLPSAGIFSRDYFFADLPVSTYCMVIPQNAVIPGLKDMLEAELGGETRIHDVPETIQVRLRCRSTANRARMDKLLASLVELGCLGPAKMEVDPNTGATNYVDLPGTVGQWEYCKLAPSVPIYRFADKNLEAPLCRYQEVQTTDDGVKLWDQFRGVSRLSTYSNFEISTSGVRFPGNPKLVKAIQRSGAWGDSYVLSTSQSNYLYGLVDHSTGATPLDDESSTRFDNACFISTAPAHVVSEFFSRTRAEIQQDRERVTSVANQQAEKEKRLAEEARQVLAAKAAQARRDQETRWDSIMSNALDGRIPSHPQFQKALADLKAEYIISPQHVSNYTWEAKVKEAFRDSLRAKQFVILPLLPQVAPDAGSSQQGSGSSVSTLILQQGTPIPQKDIAPKKSGRKSKKQLEATAAAPENEDAPTPESDTRRRRFPWNPEYDELARDAGAIIRVRCRSKRMDWSALEQVFPGVQRNSVRQRITSLGTLPGASEYYRRLDDAWAVLWLQHRGSEALPDPNPENLSDFDLPAHVTFLREHIDKTALHAGSETLCAQIPKSVLNLTSIEQILADYNVTEPSPTSQPTSWDFFFDLASEEPREREFLQHPFVMGGPTIPPQDTPLSVSVVQAAVKMTISTPEASYDSNDAAAMLTLLGDNTVKLALDSMGECIVRKKSKPNKSYPVRQYTYSDSVLAQLKGDFASSMYADAGAMRDHLDGLENDEWRNIDLTDEDGETAAFLQLVSENKLEIAIDTSIPVAGRNQLGWQSKKVADENLETQIAIRLNSTRQENSTSSVLQPPASPNGPPSRLTTTSCPHTSEDHATCSECLEAEENSVSAPDQLALLAALRATGALGLPIGHVLHELYNADVATASDALGVLTQTSPPLAYVVGYDQARIVSASELRDWTVQVVQPQSNSSETKFRMEFPRQWLSIHGNVLEPIWTAATRALAGALMFRPNINEYALRQRYRRLFDRQELNDILEYLLATKKLKRVTKSNLPIGMLGPEDEKATYWRLEDKSTWF